MGVQASAAVAGGRRRQALMQRGARGPVRAGLHMDDVRALQRDRSAEARAAVARKFGQQFGELSSGPHAEQAQAVLRLLARDVAPRVREVLAEALAPSPNVPRPIADALAFDIIEVARPMLERSPMLDDTALVEIIGKHPVGYALAAAARSGLSEAVTDALVATRDRQVVARVVGNARARFSTAALQRIAEEWRADTAIHDRLARRPGLPFELVEHLIGIIGDRLEWGVVRTRRMAPERARQLLRATRERTSAGALSREHGDRGIERRLRERMVEGDFDAEALLGHLRDGDVASFEIGLSLLSRLDSIRSRRLLYHSDRRHLAALCIKAGVPTPHYITLRIILELAEDTAAHGGAGRDYPTEIRSLQQEYETLRGDVEELDRLSFG